MATGGIDTLGERIRYAREAAGLTQAEVAAHFGISRVSVTQWENDTTKPDLARIGPLAALFDTKPDWLLESKGYPPLVPPAAKRPGKATAALPGEQLVGQKDLPIYAAARGGEGHLIVSFDAIDYVKRPQALQNVTGGYGILIVGDSMIPAYRPGDTALAHPHLPPQRETDAIFYHKPPHGGEVEAIVKHLVGFNDREWSLEQYRPSKTFKESRADWPICHRIVGRYNAR